MYRDWLALAFLETQELTSHGMASHASLQQCASKCCIFNTKISTLSSKYTVCKLAGFQKGTAFAEQWRVPEPML
jgi:hypothetical protein